MINNNHNKVVDPATVKIIEHLRIVDSDTGEKILDKSSSNNTLQKGHTHHE